MRIEGLVDLELAVGRGGVVVAVVSWDGVLMAVVGGGEGPGAGGVEGGQALAAEEGSCGGHGGGLLYRSLRCNIREADLNGNRRSLLLSLIHI